MTELDRDLGALAERLAAFDAPLRAFRRARDRAFTRTFEQRGWQKSELFSRLPRDSAGATGIGAEPREAVFALLDEICDLYARSEASRCAIIRAVVHAHESRELLDPYVAHAAEMLGRGGLGMWLERGLAAASIDDQRADHKAWLNSVGNLYVAARKARIDPAPVLTRMAERSNREMHPGAPASTREALAGFERSAYFETSILPYL